MNTAKMDSIISWMVMILMMCIVNRMGAESIDMGLGHSIFTENQQTQSIGSVDESFLIDVYVDKKIRNEDVSLSLSRVSNYYNKLTPSDQSKFLSSLYNKVAQSQKDAKNLESLALIELYQLLSNPNDLNLPILLFIKGDISATEYGDSTTLKECISDLQLISNQTDTRINNYIVTLKDKLSDLRNYRPVVERIGDDKALWICMDRFGAYYTNFASAFNPPFGPVWQFYSSRYVNDDLSHVSMDGAFSNWFLKKSDQVFNPTISQIEAELGNNKLYLAWGSEKLDIPSDYVISLNNTLAAETGNLAGSLISEGFGSSFWGSLGGDFVGSLIGNLLSSSPKQTINTIEAMLKMYNPYEIEADMNFLQIVRTANAPAVERKKNAHTFFMKFDMNVVERLGLFFFDYPFEISKNEYYRDYFKKMENNDEYKRRKSQVNDLIKNSKSQISEIAWDHFQLAILFDYYENLMINQGLPKSELYHNNIVNYLGIYGNMIGLYPKIVKKHPDIKGIYIEELDEEYGTAALFGLQKKDIILSIDDYDISDWFDFQSYVSSLKRFSNVNIKVLRKDETLQIPVTLTIKFCKPEYWFIDCNNLEKVVTTKRELNKYK